MTTTPPAIAAIDPESALFPQITQEFEQFEQKLVQVPGFQLPDGTGGVNPGDRRALFYLASHLKHTLKRPPKVLEIGTHIGASTIYLAGAGANVITVDIEDVNDPDAKRWSQYGASHSPWELAMELDLLVEFRIQPAAEFLAWWAAETADRFDLIFLDGSHSESAVTQELPLAMKLSRIVVLHDYFPGQYALWSNKRPILGPVMAAQSLCLTRHTMPLGALPWPTKHGSSVTSLAILQVPQ